MVKTILAGLCVALLFTVSAGAGSRSDMRALQMQMQMEAAKAAGIEPLAARATKAKFHVAGTFKLQTPVTKPLRCEAVFGHLANGNLFYSASKSAPVTFVATTGTCTFNVVVDWPKAETANKINITIMLYTDDVNRSESDIEVMYTQGLTPIALPANGSTTNVTFTFNAP